MEYVREVMVTILIKSKLNTMKKIIEILKNEDFDRYIFLHIDENKSKDYADSIYGISFHQGLDVVLWEYSEINPHLTEIWRRLTLNYPNVDSYNLINEAIELFCDAFIHQDIRFYNTIKKVDNNKI